MDPDMDSRTAAFSLKRPYPEASHSDNSLASSPSTPRKRVRVDDDNVQNGEESPLSRDTADTANPSPDGQEFSIKGRAAEHQENDSAFSQSIPSMNWNTGSKTRIRVSLRDRATGTMAAGTGVDTAPAASPVATAATEQMPVVQKPAEIDVSDIIAHVPKKVKKHCDDLLAQGRVAVTEGRRLFISNLDYSATEANVKDLFHGYSIATVSVPAHPRTSRPLGYAFVDLSASEEALQAASHLSGKAVVGRNVSVQLARDKKAKTNPEQKRKRRRVGRAPETEQSGKGPGLEHTSNETAIILDVNHPEAVSVALPITSDTSGPYKEGSAYLFKLPPRQDPSEKGLSDTDTGEGVILNIQNDSEQESGEITDSDRSEKKTNQRTFDGADDIDAMMTDSDSGASRGGTRHHYSNSWGRTKQPQPRMLGHLQQKELGLQLRYFYVAKSLQEIDLNEPVRCLICTERGHMAAVCEQLDCTRCGEQNTHSTRNCPLIILPSGAKRSQTTVCELCKRRGHLPDECELFWRTAGGPWDSDLSDMKIRFECYECGRRGHLGNDCPFRRPGKAQGSSSWTYHGQKGAAKQSTQGISIKGRAQQRQPPITIDDSDDDVSNFRRPKVAAPAGPGQINVKMRGGQNTISNWSNIKSPAENYHTNPSNNRIRDYDHPREPGPGKYGGRRRRSLSPREVDYGNGSHHNDYSARNSLSCVPTNPQPPLPPGPPPYNHGNPPGPVGNRGPRAGEKVRPMPSAGRQAWTQFRK